MLDLTTREQLQRLIDESVSEDLHLEYKRGDALGLNNDKKAEMSRDVSAFANSDGGQIIYGISENTNAQAIGWAGVTEPKIKVEWIYDVLKQHISPEIEGLRVKAILLDGGETAFAVTVPAASISGPHQANDGRYYKRAERSRQIMADYEIKRMINRRIAPELSLAFTLGSTDGVHAGLQVGAGHRQCTNIHFTLRNASPEPALYVSLEIYIDTRVQLHDPGYRAQFSHIGNRECPEGRPVSVHRYHRMVPAAFPVFRESPAVIGKTHMDLSWKSEWSQDDPDYVLGYSISTPGFSVEKWGLIKRPYLDAVELVGLEAERYALG